MKKQVNVEMIFNDLYGNLGRGRPIFGAVEGKTDLYSTKRKGKFHYSGFIFKSLQLFHKIRWCKPSLLLEDSHVWHNHIPAR